jgi:hypothetical protein
MQKARILFDGVEKIVEITDEFYTDWRICNEMAGMTMEESLNLPEEFKDTPFILLPNDVVEKFFSETELDKQFEVVYEKHCKKIISLIEDKFSVKINEDSFVHEEYYVSKEDLENSIVIHIEA